MNSLKWALFVILIIIIFTYLFRRAHDPLTETHVYYYDTTIENDVDVAVNILNNYHFYNVYTIYIIKCRKVLELPSSYMLTPIIYKANDCFYLILLGYRYKVHTLTNIDDQITISITDYLLRVPILTNLWSYHPFAISISKNDQFVNLRPNTPTILCNPSFNGIETTNKLKIAYHSFVNLYNKSFKEYHLAHE